MSRRTHTQYTPNTHPTHTQHTQCLADLVNLEAIAIDKNKTTGDLITGDLYALSNLTRLKSLSLNNCKLVSGSLLDLTRAANLERLSLGFCRSITGDARSLPGRLRHVDVYV